jgi:hypothetical protein
MERTKEEAKKHGYVMTMARRKRYLPGHYSSIHPSIRPIRSKEILFCVIDNDRYQLHISK